MRHSDDGVVEKSPTPGTILQEGKAGGGVVIPVATTMSRVTRMKVRGTTPSGANAAGAEQREAEWRSSDDDEDASRNRKEQKKKEKEMEDPENERKKGKDRRNYDDRSVPLSLRIESICVESQYGGE